MNQTKKTSLRVDILISCMLALTLITGYKKIDSFVKNEGGYELQQNKSSEQVKFGFDISNYHISSYSIEKGQVFGKILQDEDVSTEVITEIEAKAKDIFGVNKLRAGKDYHLIRPDSCSKVCAFVYEPSPLHYVVYDFRNNVNVNLFEREYQSCVETVSGVIESSLWNTLSDHGVTPAIIDKMEDALASSVDFYHTQKGDAFKLVFERMLVDNKEIGIGKLIGAYYKNDNGDFYAVHYENGEYNGYYDYQGRPAKSSFLKSPVKFTRISSGFNMRRFHPIRRKTIPHLGTDYAAPYGTPIRAVADGVIEEVAYTGNNGRYVKIKHDKVYQTQYLHMQGFASGMKRGTRVKQGQTIGYVGSTGLATGPHVCFRFWKNGHQVNHLREKFEPAKPLPEKELEHFFQHRDKIKVMLDQIPLDGETKGA